MTARSSGRRIVAALLLLAFLESSFGVPVVLTPQKDLTQPFPCQDNPCGCASAEQCWRHCCCHTNREKLAWAERNHVKPPDYVFEAAARESEEAVAHGSCEKCKCSHADSTPAVRSPALASHSCCAKKVRPAKSKFRLGFINGDLARRCHGLPGVVSLVHTLSLPEPPLVWNCERIIVGRVWERPVSRLTAERSPPVPPPKLSAGAA